MSIPSTAEGRAPFIVAPYIDGELAASILECPFGSPGEPCWVRRHDRRSRKTGPPHDLVVLRCEAHDRAFTVYPPGFVPDSRRQLVDGPVQHDLPSLRDVVEETAREGSRPRGGGGAESWSTQGRQLDLVARVFGLLTEAGRVVAATSTALDLTSLTVAAAARGCRALATALLELWDRVDTDDVLALGALAGCWGRPYIWDATRQCLTSHGGSRGPPTTSGRGASGLGG